MTSFLKMVTGIRNPSFGFLKLKNGFKASWNKAFLQFFVKFLAYLMNFLSFGYSILKIGIKFVNNLYKK